MADHTLGGMPICKHCGVKFSRPQSLKMHLLKTCPVFTPDMTTPVPSERQPQSAPAQHEAQEQANTDAQPVTDMTPPVSLWPQVLAAWRTDWKLVLNDMLVTERLKSHCIFCGAFFVKGGLKSHLRRSHAAEYKFQSSAEAARRSSGKCTFSPCEGCGLVLKSGSLRTHPARCEVLFQIRLAFEVHNANHGGPGAYDDRRITDGGVAGLLGLNQAAPAHSRIGIEPQKLPGWGTGRRGRGIRLQSVSLGPGTSGTIGIIPKRRARLRKCALFV